MFALVNLTRVFTAVQSHVMSPTIRLENRISANPGDSTKFAGRFYSQFHDGHSQEPSRCVAFTLSGPSWAPAQVRHEIDILETLFLRYQ